MAIVANLADIPPVARDKSYCTHNRVVADDPNGVTTPEYAGELVLDLTNHVRWRAVGLTNADWVPIEIEVT